MDETFDPRNAQRTRNRGLVFFLGIGVLISLLVVFGLVGIIGNSDLAFYSDRSPATEPKIQVSQPVTLRVPVLMYHYIRTIANPASDPLGFGLSVTPADFETQLQYLQKQGYSSISPVDLYQALRGQKLLPSRPVILTFDDGYQDFYTTAFPLLKKYNFQATIFIITGFVSEPDNRYLTWPELRELDQSGLVTIGAHTVHHYDLVTHPDASEEISKSRAVLEQFLGHPVTVFAYPGGTFNQAVLDLVAASGYDLAFTTRFGIFHNLQHRLALSRVRISGGLGMEKFVERLNGLLLPTSAKTTPAKNP